MIQVLHSDQLQCDAMELYTALQLVVQVYSESMINNIHAPKEIENEIRDIWFYIVERMYLLNVYLSNIGSDSVLSHSHGYYCNRRAGFFRRLLWLVYCGVN